MTVGANVPSGKFAGAASDRTMVPGPARLAGEKVAVTPAGRPLMASEIGPLKPPSELIVKGYCATLPARIVRVGGLVVRVKSGIGVVSTRPIVFVWES